MDIKISLQNFQKALDEKGWTVKDLATVYDGKYSDSKGKTIYNTLKSWNAGKFNPTITKLARVCDLLDCDIDYLLGMQETPRKEYAHISEMTGLSELAAEKILSLHKYGNKIIHILNALLVEEGCTTLAKIYLCASADYGSISEIIEIPDVFAESGKHPVILNPRQVRQADSMELYNSLCEFIDSMRTGYGLPTSKDV